jgi:hypothetical protein
MKIHADATVNDADSPGAKQDDAIFDAGSKERAAGIAAGTQQLNTTAAETAPHGPLGGATQDGTAPFQPALYGREQAGGSVPKSRGLF